MRKLLTTVFCVLMALLLIHGCSFVKPEKALVLNLAAQNSGYLLAKEKPELIGEVLVFSKYATEVLRPQGYDEHVFYSWAEGMMEILKLDPFLQMNFKEMIKLVKVEILLAKNQQEIAQLTYQIMHHFVKGIQAGKQ